MKCDRDCFNCRHKDCILDEVSDAEIAEIEKNNHALDNEIKLSEWMGVTGEKARHERYRYRNEDAYKAKCRRATKRWTEKNKDRRKEYDSDRKEYHREYYRKNKERILAKRAKRA